MERPELKKNISIADFNDFYWLKEELIAFCKLTGISAIGSKQELTAKILTYLQTGTIAKATKRQSYTSKFDWNRAALSLDTIITDNYRNSENVRAFLTNEIGSHFRFNTEFMKWTKHNVGKTLQEAIIEWKRIYELKKDKHHKTNISAQFEYNTYIRDFLDDNKGKTIKDAMNYWKIKRNQRGDNKYSKDDFRLT
jgi:hypothetical protein